VHEIDSAGVQLLLAARRTAAAHGLTLTVGDAGPAVRELLQRYGLLDTLTAPGDRP
jgi:ABC-type transporter Mla MlaB component